MLRDVKFVSINDVKTERIRKKNEIELVSPRFDKLIYHAYINFKF